MIRINQQLRVPLQHPLQQFVEGGKGTEIGEKIHSFQFITQDLIFQDEKKKRTQYHWTCLSLQNQCRAV